MQSSRKCGSTNYPTYDDFPPCLNEEEQMSLFREIGNCTDQVTHERLRDKLIVTNQRIIKCVVAEFLKSRKPRYRLEYSTLISIGKIGLIKAVDHFDLKKGFKFSTFATDCILNEILMYMRTLKNRIPEVSFYEIIGTSNNGRELTYEDVTGKEESTFEYIENYYTVQKLLHKLDTRERKIIELRYGLIDGEERTQEEIGKIFGISRSYVSRIEKKAIVKMKKELLRR